MTPQAPPNLSSIVITPPAPAIVNGQTQQFIATGIYNNGTSQDLTDSVNWSSSDLTVANISATGLATSVGDGAATITARSGSVNASTDLLVEEMALVAVAVLPVTLTLQIGQTQQFVAAGTFSDASQQDITQYVAWSSAAPGVASITGAGFATALAAGATMITAASGVFSGSAAISVPQPVTPPVPPVTGTYNPCLQLQAALAQLALFMSGQATIAVETPQLGRVEFNKTNIGDLQRLIQQLSDQCIAAGGPLPAGCSGLRRRPISVEVWP